MKLALDQLLNDQVKTSLPIVPSIIISCVFMFFLADSSNKLIPLIKTL